MRGLKKLMLVELKLFLREPEAFFFTLIFPLLMLFVFGSIYGNALHILLAFTLGALSFFALGFVIASLAPTGRTANIVGMVLFFPMIFFSGATFPWEVLPEGVQMVGHVLPLTYVVQLLQGLWFAEPWGEHLLKVAVLFGMLIVGVLVSAKTFRWK